MQIGKDPEWKLRLATRDHDYFLNAVPILDVSDPECLIPPGLQWEHITASQTTGLCFTMDDLVSA